MSYKNRLYFGFYLHQLFKDIFNLNTFIKIMILFVAGLSPERESVEINKKGIETLYYVLL